MDRTDDYGARLLANIGKQCERRGIPVEEADSFLEHVAEWAGAPVLELGAGMLRRVQQALPALFESYLDGKKRRHGPAQPFRGDATDEARRLAGLHGISLASIEGTGKDGTVVVGDVKATLEGDDEG